MSKPLTWEEGGCVACPAAGNMASEEREAPPRAHQPGRLQAMEVGQRRGREGAWGGEGVRALLKEDSFFKIHHSGL